MQVWAFESTGTHSTSWLTTTRFTRFIDETRAPFSRAAMGLLDNMMRSALYVLGFGTMVSSAALIPVLHGRKAAMKKQQEEAEKRGDKPRDFLKEMQ